MKLSIHSQTSTIAPFKIGNGYLVILSYTLLGVKLVIHAGILKLNHVNKRAQQ